MGDWGKRIRLVFADDGGGSELFDIISAELITKFRLKENNYNTYIYPTSVTVGDLPNTLYLNFTDFNNAQYPMTLEYLGGSLRGQDLKVEPFTLSATISWWNLNRKGDYEKIELASIDVAGTNVLLTFYNSYHQEALELDSISIAGTLQLITFYEGKTSEESLELTDISIAGTYADADGVPV